MEKKPSKKGLKVAKYSAKVALIMQDHAGSSGRLLLRQHNMGWETLEVVCGSVDSSRAHRTSRTKRVERGKIFH